MTLPFVATLGMLLGWHIGYGEKLEDVTTVAAAEWDDHVRQAMFVARPTISWE